MQKVLRMMVSRDERIASSDSRTITRQLGTSQYQQLHRFFFAVLDSYRIRQIWSVSQIIYSLFSHFLGIQKLLETGVKVIPSESVPSPFYRMILWIAINVRPTVWKSVSVPHLIAWTIPKVNLQMFPWRTPCKQPLKMPLLLMRTTWRTCQPHLPPRPLRKDSSLPCQLPQGHLRVPQCRWLPLKR